MIKINELKTGITFWIHGEQYVVTARKRVAVGIRISYKRMRAGESQQEIFVETLEYKSRYPEWFPQNLKTHHTYMFETKNKSTKHMRLYMEQLRRLASKRTLKRLKKLVENHAKMIGSN